MIFRRLTKERIRRFELDEREILYYIDSKNVRRIYILSTLRTAMLKKTYNVAVKDYFGVVKIYAILAKRLF